MKKSFMELHCLLSPRKARGRQGAYSLIETASGRSAARFGLRSDIAPGISFGSLSERFGRRRIIIIAPTTFTRLSCRSSMDLARRAAALGVCRERRVAQGMAFGTGRIRGPAARRTAASSDAI